jgi:hypothetical protein
MMIQIKPARKLTKNEVPNVQRGVVMKLTTLAVILAFFTTCDSLYAQVSVRTVKTYDENTLNLNTPDILAVAAPLTYTNFVSAVGNGFTSDRAGVVNFDQPQSITAYPGVGFNTMKAVYGASSAYSMVIGFSNPVDMLATTGLGTPISQKGCLRQPSAAPLIFKFAPSNGSPIRLVGFTVLQSQAAPSTIKAEFIQASGPSLVATVMVPSAPLTTKDTFIGRATTVGGGIVAVKITVTQMVQGVATVVRFALDDLAFAQ